MLSIKPDLYLISTILLYNQHNTFPDFACELRSPSCTSSCSVLCAQVSWHVLDLKVFFPLSATSSCFLRAAFQKSHRHSLTAGIYLGAVWKNQSWQKGWVCQGPANRGTGWVVTHTPQHKLQHWLCPYGHVLSARSAEKLNFPRLCSYVAYS